ncbi:hypothetical protein C8Q79DRAFT_914155 [Trametes meyenii]|nr:hypothetical protein C8Q79DRAFT_914155 [Trametes meyenii]
MIDRIKPKWNPRRNGNTDGLTLTDGRKEANLVAREDKGRVVFDPSVTQEGPLKTAFRVFVRAEDRDQGLALRQQRRFEVLTEAVEVFTDGSCRCNGSAGVVAGSGVWFAHGDSRNTAERVPYEGQMNQTGEVYAALIAARTVAPFAPLHIVSDSKYLTERLTVHLKKWEEQGWIGVANSQLIKEVVATLRARTATTTLRWVKGHAGTEGNVEADKLAGEGSRMDRQYLPVAKPAPTRFLKKGAAVSLLSQKIAYKGVKAWKGHQECQMTRTQVNRALKDREHCTGKPMEEALLWKALRKDPISRKARDFIWKLLHGAHQVGSYWKHIPGYEVQEVCPNCWIPESMEHILTECQAPGQREIWNLVRSLLRKVGFELPEITLGLAASSHTLVVAQDQEEPLVGETRLTRIVLSESIYLIWLLRCERVIQWENELGKVHSTVEIESKWYRAIERRMQLDYAAADKKCFGKKALPQARVDGTWEKVTDCVVPNLEWISGGRPRSGVLVGRLFRSIRRGDG